MGFILMMGGLIIGGALIYIALSGTANHTLKYLTLSVGSIALLGGLVLLLAPAFSHQVYDWLYALITNH
ncbi:hypothetical protein OZX69_08320 [Lactobacillus sp. ESL0731]|uniref:hypothetical protein n=1 Tax=unclassified Lactobacillus TaxID=2620435 RepID=UPI0023F9F66F|nr:MULTISPECIES: hypothetical protein [unclassified Lactobacillus]WEV50940.1 hypothetical protein OZX63_08315 [Lactobacillus sp. ESL0700]WEV62071.1 hypothetical protein OZX69_08320 [Lactobacillus sp. ESL0731]